MKVTHSGTTYDCDVAVKCENDKYIKLYDANGVEIASFHDISDFSEYTISGGSFIDPCDCSMPIKLNTYIVGGCTIPSNAWILSEDETEFYFEIENALISSNEETCDIMLHFAEGTEITYNATQEGGKIVLHTTAAPLADVVIERMQITRA